MKYTQFVKQFRDANPDLKMSHAECMKHPEIKKAFKEITGSGVCVNTRDGNVNIKINDAQKCETPQTSGPQGGVRRSAAPAPAIVRGGPTLPSPTFDSSAPPTQPQQMQQFLPPDETVPAYKTEGTEDPTEVSSLTGYNFDRSAAPDYGDAYDHSTKVSGDINPFTPFSTPLGYDDATSNVSSYPMDVRTPFRMTKISEDINPFTPFSTPLGYDEATSNVSSYPMDNPFRVRVKGPTSTPVVVPEYGSAQTSFASQMSTAPSAATSSTVSSYPMDIHRDYQLPDALAPAAQAAPGAAIGVYSRMEDMYEAAQQQAKNAARTAARTVGDQAKKAVGAVGEQAQKAVGAAGDQAQKAVGAVGDQAKKAVGAVGEKIETTTNNLREFLRQAPSNPQVQKGAESIVKSAEKVSQGNLNVNGRDVSDYVGQYWNRFYNAASDKIKNDPFAALSKVGEATLIAQGFTPLNAYDAAKIYAFLQSVNVPKAYAMYAANSIAGFNKLVPAAAQVAVGTMLMNAVRAGPQYLGPAVNMLQGALAMVPPAAEAIAEYGPYVVGFGMKTGRGIAGPQEGFNDSALAQFEKQWRDKLFQGSFNTPMEWDSANKKWVNVKAYRSALAKMEPLRKKAYKDLMVRLDKERDREAKLLIKSRKK